MDKFTGGVSPSLEMWDFLSMTDSFGDSAFPWSVCFGSQSWLSLNVNRALSSLVCLLTQFGWAGGRRPLQGQSLTLADPGDTGRWEQTGFPRGAESKGPCPY